MAIVVKELEPSRDDAVRMTRNEKMSMILFAHCASVLEDLRVDFADRLRMIDNGSKRMLELAEGTNKLLHDVRMTIPMEQRRNLQNTCMDYEMRTVPKHTPSETNVVMGKEEFREIVDFAREKCKECTLDDEECAGCGLYKVLTGVLPLDDYHHQYLCPYNLGRWGN